MARFKRRRRRRRAGSGAMLSVVYLWSDADPAATKIRLISARKATQTESRHSKAEQRGVELSELLTDVLKRDIEINEALK